MACFRPGILFLTYVSFLVLDLVTRLISYNIYSSVDPYVFPLHSTSHCAHVLISWVATGHVDDHRRDTRHVVGRSAQEVRACFGKLAHRS